MSTIQIVGIAVASVIVLLLVVALIVTRKPAAGEARDDETAAGGTTMQPSFLDAPPSDTLERLGKPEQPPEEAPAPGAAGPGAGQAGEGLDLDWGRSEGTASRDGETEADATTPAADEAEPAEVAAEPLGEKAEAGADASTPPADESEITDELPAVEAAVEVEPPRGKLVPLSSIIVTTSTKMVDLEDPEVRRMLTELVTFEIDQATRYREQGQNVDAVLQLTEAEKICRALGKSDTAREIRDMMRDLQA